MGAFKVQMVDLSALAAAPDGVQPMGGGTGCEGSQCGNYCGGGQCGDRCTVGNNCGSMCPGNGCYGDQCG